jgi:hypothetical protein
VLSICFSIERKRMGGRKERREGGRKEGEGRMKKKERGRKDEKKKERARKNNYIRWGGTRFSPIPAPGFCYGTMRT